MDRSAKDCHNMTGLAESLEELPQHPVDSIESPPQGSAERQVAKDNSAASAPRPGEDR